MTSLSLYEFIKQKSQEKGRPLKIICDWDETLFSFRPNSIYKSAKINMPFEEFFKDFWEHSSLSVTGSSAEKIFSYHGNNEEIKKAHEEFLRLEKERKKAPDKNSDKWKRTNTVGEIPHLSISNELLKCLKDDNLISKLVVITTTRNSRSGKPSIIVISKRERFARTFGKFPQCELGIMMVERINGQNKPHRWEWIKENHPDFDIFIDDDKGWVKSVREHFPDRIYAMPNYKSNSELQAPNIYRFKQDVLDLKDQDFALAALEIKNKKLTQELATTKEERERERERERAIYWMIGGGIMILLSVGILLAIFWRKRKK